MQIFIIKLMQLMQVLIMLLINTTLKIKLSYVIIITFLILTIELD